jgi:hypothetical protein
MITTLPDHEYLLFYRLITFYWSTVREYAHLWEIARGEWEDKRVGDFLFS